MNYKLIKNNEGDYFIILNPGTQNQKMKKLNQKAGWNLERLLNPDKEDFCPSCGKTFENCNCNEGGYPTMAA